MKHFKSFLLKTRFIWLGIKSVFKLNIGDVEISIIEESKGSLLATFEDETYIYLISYYYNL